MPRNDCGCPCEARYFVMVCEGRHPVAPVSVAPRIPGWLLGREVEAPAQSLLRYELNPKYPGTPKLMYDEKSVPIMHASVRMALEGAGVTNIQYFDAELVEPASGASRCDYFAFNVVGRIACSPDVTATLMGTSSSTMDDADVHGLEIDDDKPGGALLFRAAENMTAIVVHQSVKAAIVAAGLPGFVFYKSGEWCG